MIITRTPFRLSFFGGGTDYPSFFSEYGGSVLSTTFNKYCYVSVRCCPPFFDHHTQVRYSKIENVKKTEDIEHPLIRNCMLYLNMHNLSITYDADLPARSGLGSSSSFAVGLLNTLYAMDGKYISKYKLAEDAIFVERELCQESGGCQDQIAVAYGGFNRINFSASGFSVNPVIISKERKTQLEDRLLMFFTGVSRVSGEIAKEQVSVIPSKTSELLEMYKLVDDAEKILLSSGNIDEFGRILDCSWQLKRGLTKKISTDFIDDIYRQGKEAGALGGKLLGAGGGGFMVFFAEPEHHDAIRKKLSNLLYIPIQFETEGTKVIHYSQENYHEKGELAI